MASKNGKSKKSKKKDKKTKENASEKNPIVKDEDLETLRKLNNSLVDQRLGHSRVCENLAMLKKREEEFLQKISEKTAELQNTSNKIAEKYVKNPKEWSLNLQTGEMTKL